MADSRNVVMVDTAAFYALASQNDAYHDAARQAYVLILSEERELWTTSYALVETMALIQRRLGFDALTDFMNRIGGSVNIHWIDDEDHNQAWDRLVEQRGAGLSLVDWTVALASEMMDATIFTFDRGFANQGFSIMPA